MEYEIIIIGPANLVLNIKEGPIYKKNGVHLLGGLVLKTEDIYEDLPNPSRQKGKIFNQYYHRMLDSSLLFTDTLFKQMLDQHKIKLPYNTEYRYADWRTHEKLIKKFTGINNEAEKFKTSMKASLRLLNSCLRNK